MKNVLVLFVILFCIHHTGSAQLIKLKDIQSIKNGKLIVALTGNDSLNAEIRRALDRYWTFKEIDEYLPKKEAIKKASKSKDTFVLYIGVGNSVGMTHMNSGSPYRLYTSSWQIKIATGNKLQHPKAYAFVPSFEGDVVSEEFIVYGVTSLNHLCNTMYNDNIGSAMKWSEIFNKHADELKGKTLYLWDQWVDSKLSIEEIQETYKYPIKIVNYQEWQEAILKRKEDVAYCMIVPHPNGEKYIYVHFFVDASHGKILGGVYTNSTKSIKGIPIGGTISRYTSSENIGTYMKIFE